MKFTGYTQEELEACYGETVQMMKEVHDIRTDESIACRVSKAKNRNISDWFGKKLSRGYDLLKSFRQSHTEAGINSYYDIIQTEVLEPLRRGAGHYSAGQEKAVEDFFDRFNAAVRDKNKYLSRKQNTDPEMPSEDEDPIKGSQTLQNTPDDKLHVSDEKTSPVAQEMPQIEENNSLTPDELMGEAPVMKKTDISDVDKNIKKAAPAPLTDDEIDKYINELQKLYDEGRYIEYKARKNEIDKIVEKRATESQFYNYQNLLAFIA